MQIIRSLSKMQTVAGGLVRRGKIIGLVPTMGGLHDGHLSLFQRAKKKSDRVVASIFVNPTQFGPGDDFDRYPRDEKGDMRKMQTAGVDIAFIPRMVDIYPPDFQSWVTVEQLSQMLEGTWRPSHFKGVTTIVAKLFNVVRPGVAIFGMKDYQQAVLIRRMARDLGYPIKIIIAPTARERDGLAMSSRNRYLDASARREAVCLYYALKTAREMVRSGIKSTARIEKEMQAVISATSPSAQIDYIAFSDFAALKQVRTVEKGTLCLLALRLNGVRLIDNMKLA